MLSDSMSAHVSCCLHFGGDDKQKIIPFSQKSWQKICDCSKKWKKFGGLEGSIANFLMNILIDNTSGLPLDSSLGYHRKCYSKFTDKTRISASEKRFEKDSLQQSFQTPNTSSEDCELNLLSYSKRALRSNTGLGTFTRKNAFVLPPLCILCKKVKYIKDRNSGKRKKEHLSQCETNYNYLLTAAIEKNDEELLIQIQDKDLVAIEMRYHRSCYKLYIKCLATGTGEKSASRNCAPYQKSFDIFCSNVIEKRVLQQHEILRMSKLTELFVNTVREQENTDIVSYRNSQVKPRIRLRYPQLHFIKQSQYNKCELVLCETTHDMCRVVNLDSSSETECESTDESLCIDRAPPANILRDLYSTASALKNIIADIPVMTTSWPPNASDLTLEAASKIIPNELFNFLAWCVGASEDPLLNIYVKVPEDVKRKILSIAQDILVLSNRKLQTPKHLALGMTVRHLTGSSKLIGLLNGLGHCASHTTVLQHDTALAVAQLNSSSLLLTGVSKNIFSTLVWDNNDFGEETLSGSGTTHNTNCIIIQWPDNFSVLEFIETENNIERKGKKIKLEVTLPSIEFFTGKKKYGPPCYTEGELPNINENEHFSVQEIPRLIDDVFYISKNINYEIVTLPGWTGFNTLLSKTDAALHKAQIHYLPVLDANPTEMSTINTILHRSVQIADELNLENIVLVFHQAIYSKAQQIRWQTENFKKRLVIRLGEFHTTMAFLAVIGKRFCDAGLEDVLIESGVVAQNSIGGVLNGHHYNRSMRAHKLMSEALHRLRYQCFLQEKDPNEYAAAANSLKKFSDEIMKGDVSFILNDDDVKKHLQDYAKFVSEKNSNPTYALWNTYLEMVEILLLFVRATREGNWNLHLSSIYAMLPWFFAYDRINYARYLPIYWCEMMNVGKTHPSIYSEFSNGRFVVQQQTNYGFSKTACDQVIEQTMNRDSKTKGGLTGITHRKGAVHRWTLSQHARAFISSQCELMAGKQDFTRSRKELDASRINRDECDVKNICDTIRSMCNPFDQHNRELINIVTGSIATTNIQSDMENAFDIGSKVFKDFLNKRLTDVGTEDFFMPIKNLKLKTFSNVGKSIQMKTKEENVTLKADRNLLTRLLVIAKVKDLNLEQLMKYSLSPIPPALGNYDGSITKTNKATLLHHLETFSDIVSLDTSNNGAMIVDGMALLQQMKYTANSFGELAIVILQSLISLAKRYNCKRVDFVTDTYPDISIKGKERERRAISGTEIIKIHNFNQKIPKQMKKFLGSGENKEALVKFCFETWKTVDPSVLQGVIIFITHQTNCHRFQDVGNKELAVEVMPELESDHEEADTRLILHAAHASRYFTNVIIKSPDTDVLVLAIAFAQDIPSSVFIFKSSVTTADQVAFIDVKSICHKLGYNMCKAVLGLHVFTGCDSVSSFKGKSKVKAFKLLTGTCDYISAFKEVGNTWIISPDVINILETFTCQLYGQPCSNIDLCRYNWLRLGCSTDTMLPPNKDSLIQHAFRANYQTAIYRRSLLNKMNKPAPENHGWKLFNKKLEIQWMSLPAVPDILLHQVHCKCKKISCSTACCSCRRSGIPCTELCSCVDCQNTQSPELDYQHDIETDSETEEDSV